MRGWRYQTSLGTFRITICRDRRLVLWMNDEQLGSYHSPNAAADDVYTQATGYAPWDMAGPSSSPPTSASGSRSPDRW
jgi:hypothetical protein